MLYFQLAWRNLWRNKRRTLISAASVFLAVFLSLLTRSMQLGSCYVKSQVSSLAFYLPDNQSTSRTTDHTVISRHVPVDSGTATRWWFVVVYVGHSLLEAESGTTETCKNKKVLSHRTNKIRCSQRSSIWSYKRPTIRRLVLRLRTVDYSSIRIACD